MGIQRVKCTDVVGYAIQQIAERTVYVPWSGCRIWLGAATYAGYGHLGVRWHDGTRLVHRVAWELEYGPVPDGCFVLHHCDVPPCCNVAHLFVGTPAQNTADCIRKGRFKLKGPEIGRAWNSGISHCKHGHPLSGDNLLKSKWQRACKTCMRIRSRVSFKRGTKEERDALLDAGNMRLLEQGKI